MLENAGVASYQFRTTNDGWEEMFFTPTTSIQKCNVIGFK